MLFNSLFIQFLLNDHFSIQILNFLLSLIMDGMFIDTSFLHTNFLLSLIMDRMFTQMLNLLKTKYTMFIQKYTLYSICKTNLISIT
jgi:hypothetical protein